MLQTNPQPLPYKHVLITSLLFLAASLISHHSGIDLWLAKQIYLLEGGNGGQFPWKNNYWLSDMIHDKGRTLVGTLFILTLTMLIASTRIASIAPYRKILLYIIVATLLSTLVVSTLKHLTTIPCPYHLRSFGGDQQWVNIWQLFSPELPAGKCYPAGHASGGYAWLALAFLAPKGSRTFFLLLMPGTILGLIFGIAQQFRGAHFLSHDLATIACCWFIAGTTYHLMGKGNFMASL